MADNSAQDFLSQEVQRHLNLFDRKRQKNKFLALGIKLFGAALAGAITILLGISIPQKSMAYNNIALVLSALIAVLAAWDGFFNHRALWIRFTITTNALRALEQDIGYFKAKGGGHIDVEETDRLNARLAAVLKQVNESWQELRREDNVISRSQAPMSSRAKPNRK
ncbi:MAG TPA: DUF4231 domain-containing protein [Candidatus Saccharimonadales bacterium]|jgi:hypothetical protein|nr:DUF4231 domain-containing protein [Candidatus Saccharimonadales bacterium]